MLVQLPFLLLVLLPPLPTRQAQQLLLLISTFGAVIDGIMSTATIAVIGFKFFWDTVGMQNQSVCTYYTPLESMHSISFKKWLQDGCMHVLAHTCMRRIN